MEEGKGNAIPLSLWIVAAAALLLMFFILGNSDRGAHRGTDPEFDYCLEHLDINMIDRTKACERALKRSRRS